MRIDINATSAIYRERSFRAVYIAPFLSASNIAQGRGYVERYIDVGGRMNVRGDFSMVRGCGMGDFCQGYYDNQVIEKLD